MGLEVVSLRLYILLLWVAWGDNKRKMILTLLGSKKRKYGFRFVVCVLLKIPSRIWMEPDVTMYHHWESVVSIVPFSTIFFFEFGLLWACDLDTGPLSATIVFISDFKKKLYSWPDSYGAICPLVPGTQYISPHGKSMLRMILRIY